MSTGGKWSETLCELCYCKQYGKVSSGVPGGGGVRANPPFSSLVRNYVHFAYCSAPWRTTTTMCMVTIIVQICMK